MRGAAKKSDFCANGPSFGVSGERSGAHAIVCCGCWVYLRVFVCVCVRSYVSGTCAARFPRLMNSMGFTRIETRRPCLPITFQLKCQLQAIPIHVTTAAVYFIPLVQNCGQVFANSSLLRVPRGCFRFALANVERRMRDVSNLNDDCG